MSKKRLETTYERWMRSQDVPVVQGHAVENLLDLPRSSWPRLGGKGTFVKLKGFEGMTGMYVAEIPPGGVLNPEKHLYEEFIYVLQGSGGTEVHAPGSQKKNVFEWQTGSLFSVPLNTEHRLSNGSGTAPAVFLGFTNAPLILDVFHNPDFVFGNDFRFDDRYDGRADYFAVSESRQEQDGREPVLWQTNFVPDVRGSALDSEESKGAGVQVTQCEMGGGILVSHIAEWPSGRYHKAHYHGGGAALLTLRGAGYTLLWPQELGIRPYEAGNGKMVVKADWKEGSVVAVPHYWFHQHFNTAKHPARHLALRYGSDRYGVEFKDVFSKEGNLVSTREGGTLIEYDDEDPEIKRMFASECARNGVKVDMPGTATRA